jgi:thiol-disulfide isomerase/thioredoxin
LAASLAGVLAAAGCGTAETPVQLPDQPVAQAVAGSAAAGPGPAGAVPQTLAFTGKTLEGKPFDAAVLAGRPTVLWFWAPWCATCAMQASSVAALKQEYGDRLAVLGVAGLDDNKAMREFVTDFEVGAVPQLDDQAGTLWRRFKVVEQSTYVFLDRKGTVVHTGWLDDVDLSAQVKTLVG